MITSGATSLRVLFWENRVAISIVLVLVLGIETSEHYWDVVNFSRPIFSMAALGLLTTALSIFMVFRVNEAYSRWWEARILWGGVVNASRSFARQTTTLLKRYREDALPDEQLIINWQQELVYRHLAYVNALRISLRRESDWESLSPFLAEQELADLESQANKPTQLLQTQGRRIAELREAGALDEFGHLMLDGTLTELYSLQGSCERIKNTVFPDRVAYFTKLIAWGMAVMIPVCVMEADSKFDFLDFIIVPAMMLVFVVTERLGAELKNPFVGRANDTPMSALCRTIEIDLRQQLGETEVPEPLQPHRGVLM
jgi:putative membrane protein